MMTPSSLAIILQSAPFPGAVFTVTPGGAAIDITADGATITFCEGAWFAAERRTTPAHLSFASTPTAEQVHAEIRRVLAIVSTPADDPLYDRATAEQALAKVAAERDDLERRLAAVKSDRHEETLRSADERETLRAEVKRLTDAHAVVSQRLAGSQKEVADLESELAGVRDNADRLRRDLDFMNQRRANAQKRVTDLEQQRDEYQAAVEVQRTRANVNDTRARRCRAAVEPVWDHLDALQAFDVVGEIVGVTGKTGERGFMDAVIARVKALHQAYTTLAALLFADRSDPPAVVKALHALNNRIKVYEITEEQWEADNATSVDLERLVNYHQAPVKFADRPLTLAERAAFVIRRLWQGRANAAAEAAALRRELGDIADALGDLPDTAEREPIGDREEHLGLSTAERIRLSR